MFVFFSIEVVGVQRRTRNIRHREVYKSRKFSEVTERISPVNSILWSVTCHISTITCHLSPDTYHLSPVNCHLSPVTCHLSPVTCHLPSVTCHASLLFYHLLPVTSHLPLAFSHFVFYTSLPLSLIHRWPCISLPLSSSRHSHHHYTQQTI